MLVLEEDHIAICLYKRALRERAPKGVQSWLREYNDQRKRIWMAYEMRDTYRRIVAVILAENRLDRLRYFWEVVYTDRPISLIGSAHRDGNSTYRMGS